MTLIKHVYQNGTGDYTDIPTAFDAMLASGLSMSGEITDYLMIVDSGVYTGSISGYISYSGIFTIQGDYGQLYLTSAISAVSGDYIDTMSPNLIIQNFDIINSGISGPGFTVPNGFGLQIDNSQFLSFDEGIYNNGTIILNGSSANGSSSGTYFIYSNGYANVSNSYISNYDSGIYIDNSSLTVNESYIHHNTHGIHSNMSGTIGITRSLLYDNSYDIYSTSGTITMDKSTSDSMSFIHGDNVYVDRSIINYVSGVAVSGSVISNSNTPSGYSDTTNISGNNNLVMDPLYNNTLVGDYRLQFQLTGGSPCVEHVAANMFSSGAKVSIEPGQLKFYDKRGPIPVEDYIQFIYTQGSSLVLSNYGKEIKFTDFVNKYTDLAYEVFGNVIFTKKNVQTTPAFDPDINNSDPHPWDWDYKAISSTQIDEHNSYIIPRSIVDVELIIQEFISAESFDDTLFQSIEKSNIKPYNNLDYRGVSYDYSLSTPSETISWVVDGSNQSLIKQNTFTGETINEFPLLSPTPSKTVIKPSGLIYITVDGDYYRYRRADNPNVELIAENEQGYFQWICPDINTKHDIRGILAYKDNLFLTLSDYQGLDITNRQIVPSGMATGKLLIYSNNDLFYNYTKKPGTTGGPKENPLASGNYYPTDITAYEDGSIFVADYYNPSGLYRYNLAYDYALIQSSYDSELKVLLREAYNDVNL